MGNVTSIISTNLNINSNQTTTDKDNKLLDHIDKDMFLKIADHANAEVLFDKLKGLKDDKYINKQKFIDFTNTTTDVYFCCNRTNIDTSKNSNQIKRIIAFLHAKGIKSTSESVDVKDIDKIQSMIKDKIDQTGCFVFILTKEYLNSLSTNPITNQSIEFNYSLFEYSYIIQTRSTKRIIPLILEVDESDQNNDFKEMLTLIPSNLKDIPIINCIKDNQNENERIGLNLYNRIIDIIRTPVLIKMKHFLLTSSFNNIENVNQITTNNNDTINTKELIISAVNNVNITNTTTTTFKNTPDTHETVNVQMNHYHDDATVVKASINDNNSISKNANSNQINETKLSDHNKIQESIIYNKKTNNNNNTNTNYNNSKELKIKTCLKLIRNTDEVGKKKALATLQNLSYDDENKIIIAKEGGISICTALLKFGDIYEKHQAIQILNNLAINQSNRIAITITGGIPYIMAILREDGDQNEDKMIAINVLSKLAIDGMNNILVSIDGIPLLLSLLKKSNTTFREKKQIMKALMDLLVHNHNNSLIIEQCGGISLVLSIFKNESSDFSLKTTAALLLGSLIMSDETSSHDIAKLICDSECMSILIIMLLQMITDGIKYSQERKDVMITIGILCITSQLNQNICADEGCISILIDLLKQNSNKNKIEINIVAETLSCITKSSFRNQELIRKEGGVPVILKLLKISHNINISSSDINNDNMNQLVKEKMQLVKLIKVLTTNNDENRELLIQFGCVLILKNLILMNSKNKDNENTIVIEDVLNTLLVNKEFSLIGFNSYNNNKVNKKQVINYKEENMDILQDMSYASIIISKRNSGYTMNK